MKRKLKRPNFELAAGTWRMRNGDSVELTASETLTYGDKVFVMWTGRCVDSHGQMSWLAICRGAYSAYSTHPFDLVEIIGLAKPERVAA